MATKAKRRPTRNDRESYIELVMAYPLASIKSEKQLVQAQVVMDRLFARGRLNAGEEMYLDALGDLVGAFEDEHHDISPASDADMLRHLMEAKGVNQAELCREAGLAKSSVSEVLSGKRPFSRRMIRGLAAYFKVNASVLAAYL